MGERKRILVMEEDEAVRLLVAEALSSDCRLRVTSVGCSRDIFTALAQQDFDLVVVGCPLHDGCSCGVCDALHQHGAASARVPRVVALRSAGAQKCLGQGADQHLSKPFGIGALLQATAAGLRRTTTARDRSLRMW